MKAVEPELGFLKVRYFPKVVVDTLTRTKVRDIEPQSEGHREGCPLPSFYQCRAQGQHADETKDSQGLFSKVLVPVAWRLSVRH